MKYRWQYGSSETDMAADLFISSASKPSIFVANALCFMNVLALLNNEISEPQKKQKPPMQNYLRPEVILREKIDLVRKPESESIWPDIKTMLIN
jgi:hypothetical protein